MQTALDSLKALLWTWKQRLAIWTQDRKDRSSVISEEEYRNAIQILAEEGKNRRFLVGDEVKNFVSGVMAANKRTTEILICGMSKEEVSLYETVLSASKCEVYIVLGKNDDFEWVDRLPSGTQERITCWRLSTEDKKGRDFILFGRTAFFFNYIHNPTFWDRDIREGWIANFNEPGVVRDLKIRFDSLVKSIF